MKPMPGYPDPLYILPFDHRHSYVTGMFHLKPPLEPRQRERIADSKRVIYRGFEQAIESGLPPRRCGVLVDEEFGASILRDATRRGFITALSLEKSGAAELALEYGDDFASHLDAFQPTFAKVLLRYNPEDDASKNRRQRDVLRAVSDRCRDKGPRFMLELLVPSTERQLAGAGDASAYDRNIRPGLTAEAIGALQDAGVEPDVWKVEGLDDRRDCERMVQIARRDGRAAVGCIVLGRGADERRVSHWLEVAGSVPGFIGFAVGRTTFWDAIGAFVAGSATRAEAAARIAGRYRRWVEIFERSQSKSR